MKQFKLGILLIIAALAIAAVGSAALSAVSFDRSVNTGKILVDTDENVAIQISNISKYPGLVKTDSKGKVTLNLNEAINSNGNSGFNTDALFTIGSSTNGVFRIKNNSDTQITVSMTSETGNNNAITLTPAKHSNTTIGVGGSSEFYFTINTNNQEAMKSLNAVLHVEAK
jgi:hypothetical protein